MAESEDATEAPTAKRQSEARERGQVALSREAASFVGLAAAGTALAVAGGPIARSLALELRPLLEMRLGLRESGALAMLAAGRAVLPLTLALGGAGIAAVLLQTGFLVRLAALQPDISRINPLKGAGRLFGRHNLMEALRAVIKLAVLGVAGWWAVRGMLPLLDRAAAMPPQGLAAVMLAMLLRLAVPLIGAQGLIAAADLGWVRFSHMRQMRMSKQDVRQEARESDGDPRVKGRLRKLRAARARARMMAQVPKATVIVTNPTHYAIALTFDCATQAAPRVVAKGADEVAARIRELAQKSGVPLVANPPLARALFPLELDSEIPAEHFQAVAEIIAYVWRLRQHAHV